MNHLKIDGSFTQGLARDPIDMAVISAINDIAHSMGKRTVAEFVDDAQLLRYLRGCGVDYVQGYFVGKPTPVIESAFDRRRSNVTLLSSKSVG